MFNLIRTRIAGKVKGRGNGFHSVNRNGMTTNAFTDVNEQVTKKSKRS